MTHIRLEKLLMTHTGLPAGPVRSDQFRPVASLKYTLFTVVPLTITTGQHHKMLTKSISLFMKRLNDLKCHK